MKSEAIVKPDQLIADAIDDAEEIPDPLDGLGREDRRRSGRALHAGSAGGARGAEVRTTAPPSRRCGRS